MFFKNKSKTLVRQKKNAVLEDGQSIDFRYKNIFSSGFRSTGFQVGKPSQTHKNRIPSRETQSKHPSSVGRRRSRSVGGGVQGFFVPGLLSGVVCGFVSVSAAPPVNDLPHEFLPEPAHEHLRLLPFARPFEDGSQAEAAGPAPNGGEEREPPEEIQKGGEEGGRAGGK